MRTNGIPRPGHVASVEKSRIPSGAPAQPSALVTLILKSDLVPGDVEVGILLPPGYDTGTEIYPLLLFLHGGGKDSSTLERYRPLFETAWERGDLPHLLVATPSAGRSFYMDYRDGSQKWESLILTELLPKLRSEFRIRTAAAGTLVSGISMGGMGSLRLAFKHPGKFGAVVALEPAVEPAFAFDEIEPLDRAYRDGGIYEEIFGNPVDHDFWQANHPLCVARENLQTLVESGLQIYFEVGDEDRLGLYRGGEVMHRMLFDAGVKHEFRLVRGADHSGESIPERVANALGFIGRVLKGGF